MTTLVPKDSAASETASDQQEKDVDLNFASKYFVNYKENPEHVDFEHTYSQPCHKKYYSGYSNPARYLFTVPPPNNVNDANPTDEYIDIETLDHNAPLYFSSEKLNDQLDKSEPVDYDPNWMDKVDKKEWNIIKIRMFKIAVQILEADHLARLAFKGIREEAVRRHLMVRKTALRLKSLFGSVAWDPPSCQWLHGLILEKSPRCLVKVYTDAFQCIETKVPPHFLEHMKISTAYMSVRSRLSGLDSQHSSQKKHWDMFDSALSQHQPEKIFGDPLLVLLPTNMGKGFEPNTRPFRFMSELSLLGTLVTVNCFKNVPPNLEIPALLEQMITATVKKIGELQSDYPNRSIVLIGIGPMALLACHIAVSFKQKIAAVVCVSFNLFTVDGKIGTTANVRLMNLKTPALFIIGQNATTATVDEIEEFRSRLRCKSGLVVVGGADDHLRVSHLLKMKCAITQSVADRCITNEISEFLNDILQPSKVLVSILSNNDSIETKPPANVINPQFLKKIINESVNNPNSPIIKEITSTLAQLQSEQKYGNITNSDLVNSRHSEPSSANVARSQGRENRQEPTTSGKPNSTDDLVTLKKVLTSKNPAAYSRVTSQYNNKLASHSQFGAAAQYQLTKAKNQKRLNELHAYNTQNSCSPPVNFARRTRGGRRPYVRRMIPPKRPNVGSRMMVISSFSPSKYSVPEKSRIDLITPDSLLDMPVVFADENDEDSVINDVSLTSYQP